MEERQTRNMPKTATEVKELFKEFGIEETRFTLFFNSNKIKSTLDSYYFQVDCKVDNKYFEEKVYEKFRWIIAMKVFTVVDLAEKGLMSMKWVEETCEKIMTQNPRVFAAEFEEACKDTVKSL